jgi:hypothetical protein
MRELGALGLDASKIRPSDYTKPLNEPTWGEDEDEADEEFECEEPEDHDESFEYPKIKGEEMGGKEDGCPKRDVCDAIH